MIEKFLKSLSRKKKANLPKHIALTYNNYAAKGVKIPLEQHFKNKLAKINDFMGIQSKYDIPIFTIFLLSSETKNNENFNTIVDAVSAFFEELAHEKKIHHNKVKISVLGKWYNMPAKLVDSIKKLSEETKEYDKFFLNFCINYDGQDEIVDACRILGKKIKAEKMDPEAITKEMIKENLYSSYFMPPELLIVMDGAKHLSGFLLWDSVNAKVYFSDKNWSDFSANDLVKALAQFHKWNGKG
jgi:undecaprenyl diphosphate synthase